MIRYKNATLDRVMQLIDQHRPKWRKAADTRTAELKIAKAYTSGSPSWSDVKSVYMRLQYNKCAYCERPLGSNIEQDVEHFRPKNAVKAWPGRIKGGPKYSFSSGPARNGLLLARLSHWQLRRRLQGLQYYSESELFSHCGHRARKPGGRHCRT